MSLLRRRRFWLAVLAIAVTAGVAVTAISFFESRALLSHRSVRPAVTPADSGLAYDVVPLRARDGTVLEGWWIRPRDGARRRDLATIVLAHAADGERPDALTGKAGMLRQAAWLSRAGFIVLAFDFRSYGGSEGHRTTGGYLEQQDLEAAIRLAHERSLKAPVAVVGEGMGATVGLAVMAQDPSLVALVADSPVLSWYQGLARTEGVNSGEPWWARGACPTLVEWSLAGDLGPRPAGENVALTAAPLAGARPVMVILGDRDILVPAAVRSRLVTALGRGNASWAWPVEGTDRLRAFDRGPAEYEGKVAEFLGAAIETRSHPDSVAAVPATEARAK
jgi:fermentation-respiration switch protein FrsA (DUF1100 family)